MNKINRYKRILAAATALIAAVSAAGCSKTSESGGADKNQSAEISAENFEVAADDKDVGYDETQAVTVALDGSNAEISGKGAVCENGRLSVTEAGTYILSGSFDGQIYVNSKGSEIRLVLNGVSVTNDSHAALLIEKAAKVTLTLKDGTENSFTDGAEYELTDSEDNTDAAVFSRADLTVNGDGALNVTGNYKHGIVGKDTLTVTGGDISVNAVSGGIYGKDCVKISGGNIDVNAGSNGIRATNDEDAELGFVAISGGTINVNAVGDGIEAETVMQISGGDISVVTGGGSDNASVTSDGSVNEDWGNWKGGEMKDGNMGGMGDMTPPDGEMKEMPDGMPDGEMPQVGDKGGNMPDGGMTPPDANAVSDTVYTATSATEDTSDTDTAAEISAKGLKAGSSLNILGGAIDVDSSDDSLHSNGSIDISDGVITARSGDDGAHADSDLKISGGTIDIQKSYEGLEGLNIYISGGEISVTANDDGLNAAGGSDTGLSDRSGRNGFAESGGSYLLEISGGIIKVDASGDGLDSNGDLVVSGGEIYVSGPTNGGNGAIDVGDFGSTAQITGGTIVAAGAVGMEVGFDESSTQYNVLQNLSSGAAAGTEFTVADSDGNVLISYTFDKSYQSVVFSCPELSEGTYTVTAGDITETVEITSICTSNSTGMGGGFGGGHGGMGGHGRF